MSPGDFPIFSELFSKVFVYGRIASFYNEKSDHRTGRKFFYPKNGKTVHFIPRPPKDADIDQP